MRKQQAIWLQEHTNQATLPTMANLDPTSGVVLFAEFLQQHGAQPGRAVDIGAGKGRNSLYLASLGYEAYALEYIEPALEVGRQQAAQRGLTDRIHFMAAEIDRPWDFPGDTFDVAIDSFASIDIETAAGRRTCRDELFRTLKPGGYALVNVVSAEDEWEKELIAKHPGAEPNSTIWPDNGKFQKDYEEAELRDFYQSFNIIELRQLSKPAHKLGRDGTATNLWLVLSK